MKSILTIVGMKHRNMEKFVSTLLKGEPLRLLREPDNEHDANAVQVWARDRHIGYVKGTQAREVAGYMDRLGLTACAAILAVTAERWPCAEVEFGERREKPVEPGPAPRENPPPHVIKEGRDV